MFLSLVLSAALLSPALAPEPVPTPAAATAIAHPGLSAADADEPEADPPTSDAPRVALVGRLAVSSGSFWRQQFALPDRRDVAVVLTNADDEPTGEQEIAIVLGRNDRSGDVVAVIPVPALLPGAVHEQVVSLETPLGGVGRFVVHAVSDADDVLTAEPVGFETWPLALAVTAALVLTVTGALWRRERFVERLATGLALGGGALALIAGYVLIA